MIRKGRIDDLEVIDKIAVKVIDDMKKNNIPQWDYNYPRKEHYFEDVEEECLYVFDDNGVIGAITLKAQDDPPYEDIDNWTDEESLVVHRVIVDPTATRKGVASQFFAYAEELAKSMGYNSIKVDTHKENFKMNGFLKKLGFREMGYLPSINRIAFEKII